MQHDMPRTRLGCDTVKPTLEHNFYNKDVSSLSDTLDCSMEYSALSMRPQTRPKTNLAKHCVQVQVDEPLPFTTANCPSVSQHHTIFQTYKYVANGYPNHPTCR